MIFTGGLLGNMSGVVASLVVIPLAGMVSFLFYQMGVGSLRPLSSTGAPIRPNKSKFLLRSINRPSVPTDIDLDSIDGGNMPSCAQDVYVTLRKEDGDEDEGACKGLLIRDDIIITSKECSKSNFKFDFVGFGMVQAKPHASLNSKEEMVDSRLGFLEANPPYHYVFIDRPVRRTRMFLSDQPAPSVNGNEGSEAVIMTCGVRHEPIAHNFPADDGEMVPLVELAGIVPNDILWEARDIEIAPMLEYKSRRWWTRPITLGYEQSTIKQRLQEYDGPQGSVSLKRAHNVYVGQASALCEALDPRGHRRDCWRNYYKRWRLEKPFSGTHFFDWLDFGHGKFLFENKALNTSLPYIEDDEYCEKRNFNRKTVHYFDDEMRKEHEIYFESSENRNQLIARYKQNDQLVPPSDMDKPHLYMWDLNKTWYVVDDVSWDKEKYGLIKHSGVLAGQPGLSGGKAYFGEDGAMWGINYSSGHYRPEIEAAAMMYQWMKDSGFNLTSFHWVGREGWSTEECLKRNWGDIEIPGFTAVALNRSCHEVTMNPTWILKEDV